MHESNVNACFATISTATGRANNGANLTRCGGCGSYGLAKNPNQTTKPPCATPVDVNGDRKPSPRNINCNTASCAIKQNVYKVPLADEKKLSDIFVVLITDKKNNSIWCNSTKSNISRTKIKALLK